MIPDADLLISCPYCAEPARVFQLLTANTIGAITWTDGWMDAPAMPRTPRITRCAGCKKIYWVATASQLGYVPLDDTSEAAGEFKDAQHVAPLNEADCYEALEAGLAPTTDLELELRVFTWWRGNDQFREPDYPAGHATSEKAVANMERIIELTKEIWEEDLLLFRAEAQRHLGRFDDARESLQGVGCSDYWPAKSRQLELLEAQNRNVAILFSPERPPEMEAAEEEV